MNKFIQDDIYDNHNVPQYRFITDSNESLIPGITIFRTETLTKNLHSYGFKDYRGPASDNTYMEYLNEDSIRLINETYRKDFELFGYDMISTS